MRLFFQRFQRSWLLDSDAYDDDDDNGIGYPIGQLFDLRNRDNINQGLSTQLIRPERNAIPNGLEVEAFGSSRGMVCLQGQDCHSIFIYNYPIRNQCQSIPSPPRTFDTWTTFLRGFGYVSSKDDFKLVLRLRDETYLNSNKPVMYVYSLLNNSWRIIPEDSSHEITPLADRKGVLVNERLHWCTRDSHIFAFDLQNEAFEEITSPWELDHEVRTMAWVYSGIAAIEERLWFFICYDQVNVKLWRQSHEDRSWERVYDLRMTWLEYDRLTLIEFFGFTRTKKLIALSRNAYNGYVISLIDPRDQLNPEHAEIGYLSRSSMTDFTNYFEAGVVSYVIEEGTSDLPWLFMCAMALALGIALLYIRSVILFIASFLNFFE